jgi:1-acyl-sn-glycerol-3-phosphate acyltransferase
MAAMTILQTIFIVGSLEYIFMVVNFLAKNLFKNDLETVFKDELFKIRYGAQKIAFVWAMDMLRITFDVKINDPHAHNRLTLFVYTHAGFIDAMMTLVLVPQRCYFVAKDFFAKLPFAGPMMIKSGHIKIDRTDLKAAINALDVAARKMRQEGKSVGIAPEGTRRRTKSISTGEHLLPFKKGPFHMAKQAESDLCLVSYQGIKRLSEGLFYRPGTVKVEIGSRITKEEIAKFSVEQLQERVRADMIKQIQPPMTNEEVFTVKKTRLPWLFFITVQVIFFFVTKMILGLFF